MLPAPYRLQKSKDIEAVMKRGRGVFGKKIFVKLAKNNLDVSRFAFVAGIKVHKSAVKRNRVKRQLREITRSVLKKIKPGYDVMVMAKPGILDLEYQEMKKELIGIYRKLNLLS